MRHFKYFIAIIIFVAITLTAFSESWEYYPYTPKNGDKTSMRFFTMQGDSSILFSPGQVPEPGTDWTVFAIEKFNMITGLYSEECYVHVNAFLDMMRDKDGTLWLLTDENVFKYDAGEMRIKDAHLDGVRPSKWLYTSFGKDRCGNIWWGYTNNMYQIINDSVIVHPLSDYGMADKLFYYNDIGYLNQYLVFSDVDRDSLFLLNPLNIDNKQAFAFADYGIPDTAKFRSMQTFDNELFFMMDHSKTFQNGYRDFFTLKDGVIKPFIIKYLSEKPGDCYYIFDFLMQKNGNLMFSIGFYSQKGGEWVYDDHIIITDRSGNTLEDYSTPSFVCETGDTIEHRISGAMELTEINGAIYMNARNSLHSGILKLDLENSGVDDTEGGIVGNSVWIFNAYPNPVKDKVTLDFFCLPSSFEDLEISLYDYIGNEYSEISFNVLNYDFNSGRGKMQVNIGQVPKGIKYIQLKANEETYSEGIVIK